MGIFDYFTQNLWQFWAVVAFMLLILELTSGDFFIICFAIAAGVTSVLSLTGLPFLWQLLIFAILAVLCLFFVRPVMLKYFHRNDPGRKSNADALSADGGEIGEGTKVRVVGRDSIIITVEKC